MMAIWAVSRSLLLCTEVQGTFLYVSPTVHVPVSRETCSYLSQTAGYTDDEFQVLMPDCFFLFQCDHTNLYSHQKWMRNNSEHL